MGIGVNTTGWTVIDSGDGRSACALSGRRGSRPGEPFHVVAAAELRCAGSELEAAALRELMSQVDRRFPVLVLLARGQYRLHVMPEPTVPPRELLSSLRWSLSTESESPYEDLNVAWMPIPTDFQGAGRPRQGYAVMTPTKWLTAQLANWRQAGVRPKVVDIRETALRNLCSVLEQPGEGLALVSMDAGGVSMVFTHQGALYLDRFIEQPLAELQAAEPAARERLYERIATQLMRSVEVIGHSFPQLPALRVVVAPEPEPLGLLKFLAARLPLKVASFAMDQVADLTSVPALQTSPALQARCLAALGAALRGTNG
jgi:MSHA biogenesis protein MshI